MLIEIGNKCSKFSRGRIEGPGQDQRLTGPTHWQTQKQTLPPSTEGHFNRMDGFYFVIANAISCG